MATTTNQESVLYQLRKLMPRRPLTQFEAYRIAELQANHLLRSAGIDEPGTPDELITGQPFLEIKLRDDVPASGFTRWYKPRWLIVLNSTEPAVRRRFSLAHEYKHVLDHGLSEHAYPAIFGYTNEDRCEKVCDYFAACLLMPKRLVKQRFYQGLHDESELAAEFGVSPQAMRYRLDQLGLRAPTPRCDYQPRIRNPGVNGSSPTRQRFNGYFRRSHSLELEVAA